MQSMESSTLLIGKVTQTEFQNQTALSDYLGKQD